MEHTTIAAIATAIGASGIGVVRMSGSRAVEIAQTFFRSNSGKYLRDCKGYTACLGRVFDAQGDLDDAIATVYRAPKSYTGEEVVEISCHGGMVAVRNVLQLCLQNGAVGAAPGEFTKRAFLNGKIDLTQAEAIADIISAQGNHAVRAAISAKDGALAKVLNEIAQMLLEQTAHFAAWADYPEEEIDAVDPQLVAENLQQIQQTIAGLLRTWDTGRMLKQGIATAIVGKPNVGKSSLMNLLAGEERSIVSGIPGTTRDFVDEMVQVGDFTLCLIDTAGIRETTDPIEQIGVQIAQKKMNAAELVLVVLDGSTPLTQEDARLLAQLKEQSCIAIVNKTDLPICWEIQQIQKKVSSAVLISAKTGDGKEQLEQQIALQLGLHDIDMTAAMVYNERQRAALCEVQRILQETIEMLRSGVTLDAVNVLLDCALQEILSLTGERASDAVIDAVFSKFCVGK